MAYAKISDKGLELIKRFEGLRTAAYRDPVGIWTIGWGHTGPDVFEGLVITQAEAEALLRADVQRFERGVENLLATDATQAQFDSMVSLAFNIGINAFRNSTLLQKFNEGDHRGVVGEFGRWVFADGKPLEGLVRRRAAEAVRYLES